MDTAQIEATASHLAALGCTEAQVQRHRNHLAAIADIRAKKSPPKPEPVALTDTQITALMSILRTRPWRWTIIRRQHDAGDWIGHALASVLGQPLAKLDKLDPRAVDALHQLRTLGLIERQCVESAAGGNIYVVNVLRPYRERLDPSELPKNAGRNGSEPR